MKLRLIRKHHEVGDMTSFVFQPLSPMTWQAGQYMRWVIQANGKSKEHWFTIASPPYTQEPMITTHVRGQSAYKQALNNLKIDDEIEAKAIDGDFTWVDSDQPLIFIAGGIGVTPFHSMILQRAHEASTIPITLLHANQTEDIPYKQEFEALAAAHPEFHIIYLVGQRITAELLKQTLPDLLKSTVYVSGPEPMVDAVAQELQKLGVEDHHLKRDRFEGYEATA